MPTAAPRTTTALRWAKRLWMQTRAALRAKYPTCECNVVLLQIGCTIAVHTGPYALGMGVMRRWKKQN